jgi:hypothetical protein
MRWLGLAWDLAAWFLITSVIAAPLVALVRKCKARGKRLFRDLPAQRLEGLHPDTRIDHRWDA